MMDILVDSGDLPQTDTRQTLRLRLLDYEAC